jgi:Tex protein YqgF-like domain
MFAYGIPTEPAREATLRLFLRADFDRLPPSISPGQNAVIPSAYQELEHTSSFLYTADLPNRCNGGRFRAIQVFRDNLQNLLLAAPAGPISVLGIDPGLRTGCKIAAVDETGKFLAHDVLYLHTSKNAASGAGDTLAGLIAKHNVRAIAIGNGTASRETDAFIREFLRERQRNNLFSVTVSESGASRLNGS